MSFELTGLHSRLKPYVQVLADHEFGIQRCQAVLNSLPCGGLTAFENDGMDRFMLTVPYANQILKWEIILNSNDLYEPPDIIDEDGFFESLPIDVIHEKVPSLGDWRPSDQNCLLNFILELLNLYQEKQISILKNNENLRRYYFEYETLIEMKIVAPTDLEVSVEPSSRGTTVELSMALQLDLSELPVTPLDPKRPVALLTITYRTQAETNVQLTVWSELEDLIGGTKLPPLTTQLPLLDYVPDVQFILEDKIDKMRKGLREKQQLFCALSSLLEPSILDADSELYSKLSFLLEHDKKQVVSTVDIPDGYPALQPVLTVYKMKQRVVGQTVCCPINNYRRNVEELAQSIVGALRKEAFGDV